MSTFDVIAVLIFFAYLVFLVVSVIVTSVKADNKQQATLSDFLRLKSDLIHLEETLADRKTYINYLLDVNARYYDRLYEVDPEFRALEDEMNSH